MIVDKCTWRAALDGWVWLFPGLIFIPWAIPEFVLLFPLVAFDWIWLGFAFLVDIAGYVPGASRRADYERRQDLQEYPLIALVL